MLLNDQGYSLQSKCKNIEGNQDGDKNQAVHFTNELVFKAVNDEPPLLSAAPNPKDPAGNC